MSQCRCGVLPLRRETRRFTGEQVNDRFFRFGELNVVEGEKTFLLLCLSYSNLRHSDLELVLNFDEFRQLIDDN